MKQFPISMVSIPYDIKRKKGKGSRYLLCVWYIKLIGNTLCFHSIKYHILHKFYGCDKKERKALKRKQKSEDYKWGSGENNTFFIDCKLFDLSQQIYDVAFSCLTYSIGPAVVLWEKSFRNILKWPHMKFIFHNNLYDFLRIHAIKRKLFVAFFFVAFPKKMKNFLMLVVKCGNFRISCKC